jgi:hypothetical protein
MAEEKKINTNDLPKAPERTTTQQPEEFIDKQSVRKDETDVPHGPADDSGDYRNKKGNQETN